METSATRDHEAIDDEGRLKIRVLGTVEVAVDGRTVELGGPKQRAALALLIADAGTQVSTGVLIDGIYGEDAPDRAHRSVHTFISNLRAAVGDVIDRQGDGYILTAARSCFDHIQFEDAVARAATVETPEDASEILRRGLGLWRGHPFSAVDAHTLLQPQITRLNEKRISAIEARVSADLQSGRERELIAELEALTSEHPLNEHLRSLQMIALYRAGRQAEALRAYEKTRLELIAMGLDPSDSLRDLEQRVLNHDSSLMLDSRPTVRVASILVADVADTDELASLAPGERHRLLSAQAAALDHAVISHGGRVFGQRGSALYARFENAHEATSAAADAQSATQQWQPWLRIAIATGEVEEMDVEDVSGPPISRGAALVAVTHGGQILLSSDTNSALSSSGAPGIGLRSLGSHTIPGMETDEPIYQLEVSGGMNDFPALRIGERPPPLPISERGVVGYELREQVGSGPHGLVHRAYQPSMGREVAIKIIRPEFANDSSFIRRFEVDAQLLARLEHPNIAPLYDYWRDPDGAVLVMRWLRGGSLADRLEQGLLPIEELDPLVRALGSALDYAHRRGVSHGSLRAANVLFDEEQNVYLCDFAVGRSVDPDAGAIARDVRQLAQLIDGSARDTSTIDALLSDATGEPGFASAAELVSAWSAAIGDIGKARSQFTEKRNPYKGLRAFGELDTADFYGRVDETLQIVDAVRSRRLVAVVGPSGIGKSSVVRAGLIPAIRAGAVEGSHEWLVTDMLPGRHPYEELASALLRVASTPSSRLEHELRRDPRGLIRVLKRNLPHESTLLLVVDQFEELFTLLNDDEERLSFVEMLTAAANDERCALRIVLTMRADFFDQPLRFGELGDLVRDATVPIAAPNADAMRAMIEAPSDAEGVTFEPGLVDRIIADLGDQPGAVPLLEFSLTELFAGRTANELSTESYVQSGGVLGALGRRAQFIHDDMSPAAKDATRQLFLRLVNVNESGRDTRRRARRAELSRLGIDSSLTDEVLAAFGDHRLLTFDRDPITRGPTVEVAHEALLGQWPLLKGWIENQRDDLVLQRRFVAAVGDWEASGRAEEYLLAGGALSLHHHWAANSGLTLTTVEREFLETSLLSEETSRTARRKRRFAVMAGFATAALIASVLGVVALVSADRANTSAVVAEAESARANENAETAAAQTVRANESADGARAESLAAYAVVALDTDPGLALLLGVEAIEASPAPSAVAATRRGLQRHRSEMIIPPPSGSEGAWGIVHPTEDQVAVIGVGSSKLQMWEIGASDFSWEVTLATDEDAVFESIGHIWFSEDGNRLYIPLVSTVEGEGGPDDGVYTVDADTGETVAFLHFPCLARVMPAGTQAATGSLFAFDASQFTNGECGPEGRAGVVDIGTGEIIFETGPLRPGTPPSLSADGRRLVLSAWFPVDDYVTGRTRVYDVATGEVILEDEDLVFSVISADGSRILLGRGPLYLHDAETGERLQTYQGAFRRFFFSADEQLVIGSSVSGSTVIFDTETGSEITRLQGHETGNWTSSVNLQATKLVTSSFDSVRVWDIATPARGELPPIQLEAIAESRFMPSAISKSDHFAMVRRGGFDLFGLEGQRPHRIDILRLNNGSTVRSRHVWHAELSSDGILFEQPVLETGVTTPNGESGAVLIGAPILIDPETGETIVELEGCSWYWVKISMPAEAGPDCGPNGAPEYTWINFALDGSALLGITPGKATTVWALDTGQITRRTGPTLTWGEARVVRWPGVLLPDGNSLISAPIDLDSNVWPVVDISTGAEITNIEIAAQLNHLNFDEASGLIIGAGTSVVIIDPESWKVARLETTQGATVTGIAVSPDGQLVATVGTDEFIVVWNQQDSSIVAEIEIEGSIGNGLRGIAFLDDATLLIAPETGGELLKFTLDPDRLRELALNRLNRGFRPEECATYNINPCRTLQETKAGG